MLEIPADAYARAPHLAKSFSNPKKISILQAPNGAFFFRLLGLYSGSESSLWLRAGEKFIVCELN